MSCDSDSDSNCKNCDIPPINEQQCCAICPNTGERCKRKAVKGKHRCLQHRKMCKDLHTEYKKVCEGLLDIIYEDLTDEEFYNKYKSVQLCLYKRKKQTEICYPGYPNKYSDCYYNIKHEKILNKYEKILNKFKTRFEKLNLLKKEEFKEKKEKQKEQEYEELKEKELMKSKLILKKSPEIKKKSKQKKSKQKKKKKSPKKEEIIPSIEQKVNLEEFERIKKEEIKELKIIKCEEQKCDELMEKGCIKYCINKCELWLYNFIKLNLDKKVSIYFKEITIKSANIINISFIISELSKFEFYYEYDDSSNIICTLTKNKDKKIIQDKNVYIPLLCKLLKFTKQFMISLFFDDEISSLLNEFNRQINSKDYKLIWKYDNFYNIMNLTKGGSGNYFIPCWVDYS